MPFLGRVFGLKDFVAHTNCSSSNALVLNTSHDWPVYVSPGILLLLYYTVISLLKLRTHHSPGQVGAQGQRSSASHPRQAMALRQGGRTELCSGLFRKRWRLGVSRSGRWS